MLHMPTDNYYLIVPASGIGTRMESDTPKQYIKLNNGLTVLDQTLKTLLNIDYIKGCIVAINENDTTFKNSKYAQHHKLLDIVNGGEQRYNSVMNALEALEDYASANDWVLVHDAARPCVDPNDINTMIDTLKDSKSGGLLATRVVDTIKKSKDNIAIKTIDRENLWQAQTPQMYRFGMLKDALNKSISDGASITDEAGAIEHINQQSTLIESSKKNIKITTQADLELANFYLTDTIK